jgi:hypothetical protein
MNPQVKENWVNALLSGEYKQGTGNLKSGTGFCCLGVLCDLYAKEHNEDWETATTFVSLDEENPKPHDYWYFDGESEFLPTKVMKWAGLDRFDPDIELHDPVCTFTLAELNDNGSTFGEIAKLIDEQL